MKTWGDIEKKLEDLKADLEQARIDENYWAEDRPKEWIECLEWVLDLEEGEASHFTWTKEWDDTPIKSDDTPVKSWEEIRQDILDSLEAPFPFFKYLKEKSDEKRS